MNDENKKTDMSNQAGSQGQEEPPIEVIKKYLRIFAAELKRGFVADQEETGFKPHGSRFLNLWKSRITGKVTMIMGVLILLILVSGRAEGKKQQEAREARIAVVDELKHDTNETIAHLAREQVSDSMQPELSASHDVGKETTSTRAKTTSDSDSSKESDSTRAKTSSKHKGLTIKGFYIGMSIDEAQNNLSRLVDDSWTIADIETSDQGYLVLKAHAEVTDDINPLLLFSLPASAHLPGMVSVYANSKTREVIEVYMNGKAVNYLFNVYDMNAPEFVQGVVDNYKIPSMTLGVKEPNPIVEMFFDDVPFFDTTPTQYWQYKEASGTHLIITEDKDLTMKKIASSTERKFD